MEETVKKKKNWSIIILWIINILLIGTVILFGVRLKTLMDLKGSNFRTNMKTAYDIKNLKYEVKTLLKLSNPPFTFTGEGGLQKLNDGIMVSVEKVEKYLNGYKIKLGVLNTSSVKLSGIDLSLYKETKDNYFWPKTSFKISKDLNVGTLVHKIVTLGNTTEDELTSTNWSMKASVTFYYFKDEK